MHSAPLKSPQWHQEVISPGHSLTTARTIITFLQGPEHGKQKYLTVHGRYISSLSTHHHRHTNPFHTHNFSNGFQSFYPVSFVAIYFLDSQRLMLYHHNTKRSLRQIYNFHTYPMRWWLCHSFRKGTASVCKWCTWCKCVSIGCTTTASSCETCHVGGALGPHFIFPWINMI